MKQFLKLTALFLFAQLCQLQAQTSGRPDAGRKTWDLTASFNPAVNLRDAGLSLGADIRVERRLTDLLGATFSAGFTSVSRDKFIGIADQNIIPLKIGAKIYATSKYYLAGDIGLAIDINGNSNTAWSVILAKQLNNRFDIGIKYDDYAYPNLLGLRLGYRLF
ncbi:hypothetical protein OQY15_13455 [Pedobacter sp. MC2016-15]|uniref:hypothetical protein n=1 Tax=Pedobacter sp. MC2016-15 TaxID=2994473 RepID=UPI0022461303|nr:hypothetical protein [Pedobacter sp. MC2016-15]MCX2480101.1 hypothetical protein [Pedobacter sp. MC2016-15]